MAVVSQAKRKKSDKVFRPKKGGTESSRKHHFESFSHRIAKLNIDPIRRTTRRADDEHDLSTTTSYLKTSFDEWKDLNLSESFHAFSRELDPLCESLPQILHHADSIMDLLVRYIEKRDALSLEPLLSLVSHFAHDLGARFEKYFARTVRIVCDVAAKHPDIEVIEWSFTCLAWLFKYLSRLLVPDLRPLYDLMAPLLGKEHQKSFVSRFAAEAMSFLVRKAGASYHRDKEPLQIIVSHALADLAALAQRSDASQYQRGLMTLFVESVKGVQNGLHSSAEAVFGVLLEQALASQDDESLVREERPAVDLLQGVLTATIHHTNSETFRPVLQILLGHIDAIDRSNNTLKLENAARLLFTVVGVRKGTRIADWSPVMRTTSRVVASAENTVAVPNSPVVYDVLAAVAVILQLCPMDIVIPHLRILDTISSGSWQQSFLYFCNFFSELGMERFQSILLPHFRRFIVSRWRQEEHGLALLLPRLAARGCFRNSPLTCPPAWQEGIIDSFKKLSSATPAQAVVEGNAALCNAYLDVVRLSSVEPKTETEIYDRLFDLLSGSLDTTSDELTPEAKFGVGAGFKYVAENQDKKPEDKVLWASLCSASAALSRYPKFAEATLQYLKVHAKNLDMSENHVEILANAAIDCLGSPSHYLRTSNLEILQLIYTLKHDGAESDLLSTAILIESTPINIQTARTVSMNIRRLAAGYKNAVDDSWIARAIPTFCFGLLYVNFTQVWEDSCNALKEMCETKEGETVVSELAFKWLEAVPSEEPSTPGSSEEEPNTSAVNEFECTNIIQLSNLARQASELLDDAPQRLVHAFDNEHQKVVLVTAQSRSQALKVLNTIPQVAEKKSRSLVPTLLRWATGNANISEQLPDDGNTTPDSVGSDQFRWARKDQKAMLGLFTKFTNPKVLYKAADVYSSLLALLGNGDVEIQKSALKAILTWKNRSINRYEENLMNILDDARFREQISVFLDLGQDDESMKDEDRPEVMPIILRLLYGKVVARAGSSSGKRGQESRRKAVFIALSKFGDHEIRQFLDIALGPLANVTLTEESRLREGPINSNLMDARRQFGLLNMLEDMLDTLGTQMGPFAGQLIDPILYCLVASSRESGKLWQRDQKEASGLSLINSIRQVGFHCLNGLFTHCAEFEQWAEYIPAIVQELVEPRLEKLPAETAQSISGMLRLFSAWSKFPQTAPFLVKYNDALLDKAIDCLDISFAKEPVKLFVLRDILLNVIALAEADSMDVDEPSESSPRFVRDRILRPKSSHILNVIGRQLQGSPGKDLLDTAVSTVSRLAPFVAGSSESESMIRISIFLLQQPTRRVSPRTKGDLLSILHSFIPQCTMSPDAELTRDIYRTVCSLFSYFQDRRSRSLLCNILTDLAQTDSSLSEVSVLAADLNSFSENRLDEPDFDRRSKAYYKINEERYKAFLIKQWQPLVHNMLFYIKEQEELMLRINASYALRRFVEVAARDENKEQGDFQQLITTAIIPGIRNGVREKSELVRVEYLSVLAHIVKSFPTWSVVSDMHVLLVGDDDEASVFSNILHIQQHRRLRALRRLASEASKISSTNISHIFVPLVEHFIFDRDEDDSSAANLAGETTRAIGSLALWLEWPQYRALLRRYSQGEMDKTTIKLLGVFIDSLSRAAEVKGLVSAPRTQGAADAADEEMVDADDPEEASIEKLRTVGLARTMPSIDKLSTDLMNNLLPPLITYIHHKDESTVSLRVPVAVIVVKLLRLLPPVEFADRLPAVLMDTCAILRSKDQQARDMTRNTLADISALIGPEYFGFLLKALRTALQRGYQLHVLSFTVHSILIAMTPTFKPGELDYCLDDIVSVIMDDIFGVTGQEKDAEEYISKMKEVKSSKSFDSMEHIAKTTTIKHFIDLVNPVRSLLLERLDIKMVKKIDELLRRMGLGIMHNEAIHDREVLVFCYQLIQAVYKSNADQSRNKEEEDYRTRRYLINMKAANKNPHRGATSSHSHKLIRFSLDVMRFVLSKHDELKTPSNLAGFMPIIGDAIVSGQEEIQMSAVRLLSSIIKVPLEQIDRDAPIYVSEAVRIIRGEKDTNTELAQACLKLISAVLRERRNSSIKEKDIAYLLKRIKDDLTEPDRQGVTFNFLKAVLGRKIVITEVYEILDTVASVMVTNQTRMARDLSRGVYFQFLMDYPQSKERLSKQIAFLVKNLDYKYKEGRQSVMEATNLLLSKIADELVQEIADSVFAPLVLRLVNDEDKECREMAGLLLKKVFERADAERTKKFVNIMKAWLEQEDQMLKRRLAIQCFSLYFEVKAGQVKETKYVLRQVPAIITEARERQEEGDWELIYYSLQSFAKLCKLSPATTFAVGSQSIWTTVRGCLTYPHAWVKLSAARLIGLYFADFASHNAADGYAGVPLTGSGGLQLGADDMLDLTSASLRILRVPGVSEELAIQAVRNLVFLGRCFGVNGLEWKTRSAAEERALKEAAEESSSSASDEDDAADDEAVVPDKQETTTPAKITALHYLITRLSLILRREPATTRAPALFPKTASMTLLAALCNALPAAALEPSLPNILLPLHNLTDPSIPPAQSATDEDFNEAQKELGTTAAEVMALLQKKLGTSEYVQAMGKVREGVKERREGRRVKRALERVAEPERAERVKRRKRERGKEKRKEKGHEARGKRRGW
ncbi:U3 small nucleolar RNA-associated protein 20 [Diplodia seriata]|uniref:U3 small nucleolar RNA-associated protein 20 n=1 Tax=Diplodia seriata TaxID=420778 RepID=A0A1S8B2V7_9PEZI|nr:U3 small nucleolar RNA-associated protein 20 [Diplodia seriata]